MNLFKKSKGSFLVGFGYLLSPLSWWNDLFFNLPIAYGFAYLFNWIFADAFIILTVIGYWLSNIIGILMMQWGTFDLFFEDRESNFKRDVLLGLAGATIYTVAVVVLLYFNIIDTPDFLVAIYRF
ncbi:MAG: hypothetical protein BRC33_12940 [Cyanobacteria bacterium SW_9_44_58]|nr:MAG: hypothetical protein BRC33_12940 [Cyanobacteria bacterium SW_9_44_58]